MHFKHNYFLLNSTTYCNPRDTLISTFVGTSEVITPSLYPYCSNLHVSCVDADLIYEPSGHKVCTKAFGSTGEMTIILRKHEQLDPLVQEKFLNRDPAPPGDPPWSSMFLNNYKQESSLSQASLVGDPIGKEAIRETIKYKEIKITWH